MTHGQTLIERPDEKEAHSKFSQTVLCAEVEKPAEKLRFTAKRGPGSRKRRELKHHEY